MKRTFIAVPVEPSEKLLRLMDALKGEFQKEQIKWADPANLHITLQFLGETPGVMIDTVCEILSSVSENHFAGKGEMAGLGTFTADRKPSVLFSCLYGLPVLEELACELVSRLEMQGFTGEKRKFRPHLTLARIKYLKEPARFISVVRQYQTTFIQNVCVEKMTFFESILLPGGPLYKSLKTVHLKKEVS